MIAWREDGNAPKLDAISLISQAALHPYLYTPIFTVFQPPLSLLSYYSLFLLTVMISNPPPYCAETTLHISLHDGGEQLYPDHSFYQLVEETRRGFLSSNNILEYIATSTLVENELTPQSKLVRVGEIRNFLQYNFPVVVGTIHAAIGGGLPHDASLEVQVSMEHTIYLDQFMIDAWLKKSSSTDRPP